MNEVLEYAHLQEIEMFMGNGDWGRLGDLGKLGSLPNEWCGEKSCSK